MKKIILMILVAGTINNSASAQEIIPGGRIDLRDQLLFGLKAGANYSNVYDIKGENFNTQPKFGIAAGGFISIPLGRYIGIQPEILFSQKGFKATGDLTGSTYNLTRTTSYIDVPVFLAFKPAEFFTLLAGPQYSYLVQQDDEYTNGTTTLVTEQQFTNDNLRRNTLCFVGGFDINVSHLVLSARAGWDIQHNNGDGTSIDPQYKNVWYQATIGFRFL